MNELDQGWFDDWVTVAGCRLHVQQAGAGPALVLLPDDVGVPGWLQLHRELSQHYRLVLLSHPGFGRSERPDWARNVRDLAAMEMGAIRKLRLDGPAILGFGLGGWIATEMAVQCGPCFSRMVLAAPFGLKPLSGEIYDQFLGKGDAYARLGFADSSLYEATYGPDPDMDTLEGWEINREMTARVAWSPYLFDPALPHLLPLIETPALVLWGAEDRIVPSSEAERWARLLGKARAEVLPASGHRLDIEQGSRLAALVRAFVEE